jgi:hypothetical protein
MSSGILAERRRRRIGTKKIESEGEQDDRTFVHLSLQAAGLRLKAEARIK